MFIRKIGFICFISAIFTSIHAMEREQDAVVEASLKKAKAEDNTQAAELLFTYLKDNNLIDLLPKIMYLSSSWSLPEQVMRVPTDPIELKQKGSTIKSGIKDCFNTLQCRRLVELCQVYNMPTLFKTNKEKAYELMMALIVWIQHTKALSHSSSVDDIKQIFENESNGKSVSIVSGTNSCSIPEEVASFFTFLHAVTDGKFINSGLKKLVLTVEVSQDTLSLFSRLLMTIYGHSRLFPAIMGSDISDQVLRRYLVVYLTEEAGEKNLALTNELLPLSHHYDIKILLEAIVILLKNSVTNQPINNDPEAAKPGKAHLASAIPLSFFPALCGSSDTDYFVLELLGHKLNQLSSIDHARKRAYSRCNSNMHRMLFG